MAVKDLFKVSSINCLTIAIFPWKKNAQKHVGEINRSYGLIDSIRLYFGR